jgi:mRNA-degrading endonuclease RelE of RelBE toxin-antitoxin system
VTYDVDWSGPARRAVASLPEKVATAAIEFIYSTIATNPHRAGHALHFELEGLHSARRGDHRIVYRIDDDGRRVTIEAIQHRSDVYRRR